MSETMNGAKDLAVGGPQREGAHRFTQSQRQRLGELLLRGTVADEGFADTAARDRGFEELHQALLRQNLGRLADLRDVRRRPLVRSLEASLVERLTSLGFVEVVTPIFVGKGSLEKLGLDEEHPLWRQIFWVDGQRCLRPMLAPNLYYLLSHLQRLWPLPVRIFEVGPCFRKESKGAQHLTEFTMLNLVELGPTGAAAARLEELAHLVLDPLGLAYELRAKESEVYGATIDIEWNGLELASGVAGPHPLDDRWEISDPWAGWGIGLERLAMALEGSAQIRRFGRSLMYLDGARLNVQGDARLHPRDGGRDGTEGDDD
jgi:pyrrolysyl-tRNA synthetase-like protein